MLKLVKREIKKEVHMNFDEVKNFMDRLTAWRIPGNSITVYKDNKKVFEYSSGYSDLENKIPMNGSELLGIWSCSKIATVTAALQLYEKGYFLLDDPIYEYIPEYKDMFVKDTDGNIKKAENHITIRHLFTMTAGMTYNLDTKGVEKARNLTAGKMDTVTVAKCLAEDPLLFEPGTKWNYSLCHDVLAAFVEIVSGVKFGKYVKDNIFDPIGVTKLYYDRSPKTLDEMAPQYLFKTNEEKTAVEYQMSASKEGGYCVNTEKDNNLILGENYESGGAGIATTVPDYAVFASALANGGVAPNGERILSPGTIELMRTNQLNDEHMKCLRDWHNLRGYGFGLGVRTLVDKAKGGSTGNYGEFGWGGAAGATLLADPDNNLAYFYAHHMLNAQENYYQPRLRNVVYSCLDK